MTLVSSLALFLIASYEATFSVMSRSYLERLRDNGVPRAAWMLRIHAPRHRLHLMAQSAGA